MKIPRIENGQEPLEEEQEQRRRHFTRYQTQNESVMTGLQRQYGPGISKNEQANGADQRIKKKKKLILTYVEP